MELIKIDGLPAVAETIRNLLGTTIGATVLAVFVFLFLLIKIPQIPLIQSFHDRKASRLKKLLDHAVTSTDELFCKNIVEDVRNAMIFEQATGIYAEKSWRKQLVELHERTHVSWIIVKRAHRFMKLRSDGSLYIRELTVADKFDAWFNLAITWFFLAMAILVFGVVFLYKPTFLSVLVGIVVAFLLIGLAFISAFQNAPQNAAKLLRTQLASVEAVVEDVP